VHVGAVVGVVSENTHVYIGTLPCGCHVAAAVDDIESPRQTAKYVAEMIRHGYSVTRHALADLHGGAVTLSHCVHKAKQGLLL
jgi:hypothetical protein